eukprot:3596732-Lingulodinium_polyedra.AAC.1
MIFYLAGHVKTPFFLSDRPAKASCAKASERACIRDVVAMSAARLRLRVAYKCTVISAPALSAPSG